MLRLYTDIDLLENVDSVKELLLDNCKLPDNVGKSITSLTLVKFTTLPTGMEKLNLKELIFDDCTFKSYDDILVFKTITDLQFFSCGLTELPDLTQLPLLCNLKICDSKQSLSLPDNFDGCLNLRRVDCRNTLIAHIPESFWNSPITDFLYDPSIYLKREDVVKLKNLEIVYLSLSDGGDIPEFITQSKTILNLHVGYNLKIPDWFVEWVDKNRTTFTVYTSNMHNLLNYSSNLNRKIKVCYREQK